MVGANHSRGGNAKIYALVSNDIRSSYRNGASTRAASPMTRAWMISRLVRLALIRLRPIRSAAPRTS
jgi:hypothetical protein